MSTTASPLDDLAFMKALLDTVIPPRGAMPGAGSLGIEGAVATAIAADPRSGPLVRDGAGAIEEAGANNGAPGFAELEPAGRVSAVKVALAAYPLFMDAFARHVYLAYYQHPAVLAALGEPARPPFPEGFTIAPTDPDLLASLTSRR